jgi:hypothetical protein
MLCDEKTTWQDHAPPAHVQLHWVTSGSAVGSAHGVAVEMVQPGSDPSHAPVGRSFGKNTLAGTGTGSRAVGQVGLGAHALASCESESAPSGDDRVSPESTWHLGSAFHSRGASDEDPAHAAMATTTASAPRRPTS